MILTCPECATRYLTKDGSIGPNGRTVRCSKCDISWFVASELDELVHEDNQIEAITAASAAKLSPKNNDFTSKETLKVPEKAPESNPGAHVNIRDKADNKRRSRRLKTVALMWLIPFIMLMSAVGLAYNSKQEIVRKWPKTATLYKAMGIEISLSGLKLEDPVTRNTIIEDKNVLIVNGGVRNISSKTQDVPLVKFSLHDKADMELASWFVDIDVQSLEKNARADFVTEYPNPPLDAVVLHYQFEDNSGLPSQDVGKVPQTFK